MMPAQLKKNSRRILLYMGGFAQIGGIEIFARDLGRLLIGNGDQVTLAYWPIRGVSPIVREMEAMGVQTIRGRITRGARFDLPDRSLVLQARSEIAGPHLIYLFKLFPDAVLERILRAARRDNPGSAIIYVPPYCPAEDETYQFRPKPDPRLVNQLDAIVAQCPAMEEQCRSFLGYEGHFFRFPYFSGMPDPPVSPLPPTRSDRPIRMGYLGRLSRQKNVEALLTAFEFYQKAKGELPDHRLELHLYGGGDQESFLRARASQCGAHDRIFFHGPFHSDDIPRIAAENHFFAQTTRFEGQCLAAVEILACGRYLLATRAGCLADALADESVGTVIEQDRPDLFADAIERTIDRLRAGLVRPDEIARYHRNKFSPRIVGPQYLAMNDALISERAAKDRKAPP